MKNENVRNNLALKITELEQKGFVFRPNRQFYIEIQIRQKRWGQIYRNEKPATLEELAKISAYFQIPLLTLIAANEAKIVQ